MCDKVLLCSTTIRNIFRFWRFVTGLCMFEILLLSSKYCIWSTTFILAVKLEVLLVRREITGFQPRYVLGRKLQVEFWDKLGICGLLACFAKIRLGSIDFRISYTRYLELQSTWLFVVCKQTNKQSKS